MQATTESSYLENEHIQAYLENLKRLDIDRNAAKQPAVNNIGKDQCIYVKCPTCRDWFWVPSALLVEDVEAKVLTEPCLFCRQTMNLFD